MRCRNRPRRRLPSTLTAILTIKSTFRKVSLKHKVIHGAMRSVYRPMTQIMYRTTKMKTIMRRAENPRNVSIKMMATVFYSKNRSRQRTPPPRKREVLQLWNQKSQTLNCKNQLKNFKNRHNLKMVSRDNPKKLTRYLKPLLTTRTQSTDSSSMLGKQNTMSLRKSQGRSVTGVWNILRRTTRALFATVKPIKSYQRCSIWHGMIWQ